MKILACEVPTSTLEAWSKIFVFQSEPFYLTAESRELLLNTIPRSKLKPSLEFSDAYFTYSIPAEANFVAKLESQEFRSLPQELQTKLIAFQIEFHRGQIYDLAFARGVLGDIPAFLEPDIFEDKFVLHFDVWNAFAPGIRFKWLAAYVSIDREDCLSSSLPKNTWAQLPAQVRALAGRFSNSSGANCFATVIAGLTPDLLESQMVAQEWMWSPDFLQALQKLGFHDAGFLENPVKPGSVLIWSNEHGIQIHACLTLEFGLVLNKDAQSWFAPRQICTLESILKSWAEDASDVRVWTRDSSTVFEQ